jgi:[acyl-carrier-protein] S-malonyltransferase
MMDALAARHRCVKERFGTASDVLGFDLWNLITHGPETELNRTEHTQPALLAASVATWDAWQELGGARPDLMAGHSFGEYSALVCAGALDFATAVRLVACRGRFMQEAVQAGEGAMAAILGLDQVELESICAEVSASHGICACANLNAPGQIVISGAAAAVDAACTLASTRGAKRALRLQVSVPAHCALMDGAARRLGLELDAIELTPPGIAVVHNVDVRLHADAGGIKRALVAQMCAPVRWIETIEQFATRGVTSVIECGPGKVLSGLIKRIDKRLATSALNAPDDFTPALLQGARTPA